MGIQLFGNPPFIYSILISGKIGFNPYSVGEGRISAEVVIQLKVQEVDTIRGERYLLLDDNYQVIENTYRYLKYLDACGKSPNTLRSTAYHLKLFYEYLQTKEINIFELFNKQKSKPIDTLAAFMMWLQYPDSSEGVIHLDGEQCKRSNRTVNNVMSAVLNYLQYLSSNNEIGEIDVYRYQRNSVYYSSFLSELYKQQTVRKQSILRKPTVEKEIKAITRNQYNQLFKAANSRRDRLLLAFLFEGGLRLGEALGVHIRDLSQIEDGIVRIVPRENNLNGARVKRYAGGIIKLPDYVIDLIIAYLSVDISSFNTDYFFLTMNGINTGEPLKSDTVEKLFARLSRIVGFKATPHMLRHGFATEKLEAGWEMVDIQAYLRHKSITSTQIYATYSDELKLEKMREFFALHEQSIRDIVNEIES